MRCFRHRLAIFVYCAASLSAAVPPARWVPARWPWSDPKTLNLLAESPINCLLLNSYTPDFVQQAGTRNLVTLAVIKPGGDPVDGARKALAGKLNGVVLEGDFPDGTAARVRDALAGSPVTVIELTQRSRMRLGGSAPVIGTYQGVWPGIQVMDNGATKAGPTGSPWIDTNSGFIRSVRAWGNAEIWLGNLPPPNTVVTGERYLQAIADAAIVGGRWIVALDDDFASRLLRRDPAALKDWANIGRELRYFEDHRMWRELASYGKLAIVQDPSSGALLSGGILDMIATKHTPVRAVPRQLLKPDSLKGASMAVDVDSEALTPEQRDILRSFTRSGGTLLTGPPGWKDHSSLKGDQITLEKAELDRLNDIWRDVQSMIGRQNLGARLFNVSSMLSNLQATPDGKQVIVQLVNYSGYPVENVTVHVLGTYRHARVFSPDAPQKDIEVYSTDDGTGVDLDKVSVCATVQLD